ncbi:MAG: hypothetical protein C4519_07805, partial [Desulfobacteraceae bacterium]
MTMQNADIADIFNQMADLLEIEGENVFRVRAYRNAARTVADLPYSVSRMAASAESLTQLPGIGKDLASKIMEICQTGALAKLKELEAKTPPELCRLLKIANLGPKRVKALQQALGIRNLDDLKAAARAGKIQQVEGFGVKTEQSILEALDAQVPQEAQRFKLFAAEQRAQDLVDFLSKARGIEQIAVAGSLRRRKETVGDLDILVTCRDADMVIVKNASGADRARFEILGINTPVITPTDNLDQFLNRPALSGVVPTAANHWGKFVVLAEPIR